MTTYRKIPQLSKDIGLDFWIEKELVWALDLPIESMNIKPLIWLLHLPFWDEVGQKGDCELSPIETLNYPELHPYHYKRMLKADTDYPINLIYINEQWLVLDGLHRLLKTYSLGEKNIKVKKAYPHHIPEISNGIRII